MNNKLLYLSDLISEKFMRISYKASRYPSIRKLFKHIFLLLILISVAIFMISSFHFSRRMRGQFYGYLQQTMELYNEQMTGSLNNTLSWLLECCTQNSDITSLDVGKEDVNIYTHAIRIKNMLSLNNLSPEIGGLFIYSKPHDIYIPQVNESKSLTYQNNYQCSLMILDLLRNDIESINLDNWFVLEHANETWFVRIMKRRNTYMGTWYSTSTALSSFQYFIDMGASILYIDKEGRSMTCSPFSDIIFSPEDSLEMPSTLWTGFFDRYLTVSRNLSYCDYYIMALIPFRSISGMTASVNHLIIFFLLWIIFFGAMILFVINFFLETPTRILAPVISDMHNKKFTHRIEPISHFQEIMSITDTFNDMIGEIETLRIDIYEREITGKELELQYLKSQVAPHFLINCLNTVFVLSQDPQEAGLSQEIIRTLSEHLRYTLSNRTWVALEDEIYYVQNYIEMTQLRFPGSITYEINIEPDMKQAKVFPLIVLMLTENSIKSNVVMQEPFHIRIEGHCHETGACTRVHITHVDSGTGFDEDSLGIYNNITEHEELLKDGHGVGIYNIVMRMKIVMGEDTVITFSNEKNSGARIDLDFPFIKYIPN